MILLRVRKNVWNVLEHQGWKNVKGRGSGLERELEPTISKELCRRLGIDVRWLEGNGRNGRKLKGE